MGNEDSALEGMAQAFEPEIRSDLKSLYYDGFGDEMLAYFAHQVSKR